MTFQELEVKQDPEESREITPQSPPSGTLKPGWIGEPTNWICHVGGLNLQPSWGGRPMETHPEDLGLLLNSSSQKQGLPRPRVYCTPAPKCLTWNVFLPDELSYQDM